MHFRGEPDPFKGDIPNQKVREAAKEALDAVFAPVDTMHTIPQQPAYAVSPLSKLLCSAHELQRPSLCRALS